MNFRKRILFLLVLVLLPLVILPTGCSATKPASTAHTENANTAPSKENKPDASVYYDWGATYYKISQNTADTIQRKFEEFQELAIFVVQRGINK